MASACEIISLFKRGFRREVCGIVYLQSHGRANVHSQLAKLFGEPKGRETKGKANVYNACHFQPQHEVSFQALEWTVQLTSDQLRDCPLSQLR